MDLTGLDDIALLEAASTGEPLWIPLDEIIRDPEQPRTIFDQTKLKELAEGIKERGVKSPISLRPKNVDGKYIINHGERRWLASRMAGVTHIPAFLDAAHDEFDQVAENILRDDLKPIELADWIQRQLEKGYKQVDIARKLKKGKDWVSRHVKIASASSEIRAVADRCADYTALYELALAYEKYPSEILEFIANVEQIARRDISQFVTRCKNVPCIEESSSDHALSLAHKQNSEVMANDAAAESLIGDDAKKTGTWKNSKPAAETDTTTMVKVPVGSEKVLSELYIAQVINKRSAEAVISELNDDEWEKVYLTLSNEHKKGLETDVFHFPNVLINGLQSGAYSHTDHRLYSMLAFINGVIHKEKTSPNIIKKHCFIDIDKPS